jgi:FkbM family methyltransferase
MAQVARKSAEDFSLGNDRSPAVCFDDVLSRKRPVIVFGAGTVGRWLAQALRDSGARVSCFADETAARIGTCIDGLRVVAPTAAAAAAGHEAVMICAFYSPVAGLGDACERLHRHTGLAVLPFLPLLRLLPGLGSFYGFHPDAQAAARLARDVEWLFDRLSDDESRAELSRQVRLRESLWPVPGEGPVPSFSVLGSHGLLPDDVNYVDCGAYDGDTLLAFTRQVGGRYGSALALEPDPESFSRLVARIHQLPAADRSRVTAMPAGVWDRSTSLAFEASGTPASYLTPCGASRTRVVALDDLLDPGQPHFIKFDVEGAEQRALNGTRKTVLSGRTALGVSLYHRPDDLAVLPRLVAQLMPGARVYLRAHGFDGTDLMLYAFPERR